MATSPQWDYRLNSGTGTFQTPELTKAQGGTPSNQNLWALPEYDQMFQRMSQPGWSPSPLDTWLQSNAQLALIDPTKFQEQLLAFQNGGMQQQQMAAPQAGMGVIPSIDPATGLYSGGVFGMQQQPGQPSAPILSTPSIPNQTAVPMLQGTHTRIVQLPSGEWYYADDQGNRLPGPPTPPTGTGAPPSDIVNSTAPSLPAGTPATHVMDPITGQWTPATPPASGSQPSVQTPPTSGNPAIPPINQVTGPWFDSATGRAHEDFRGFTPLVTGEGEFKTVWPAAGDLMDIFAQYLGGQVGGGATPFPAELSAAVTPMLEQLAGFLSGGAAQGPFQSGLRDAANSGLIASLSPTSKIAADSGLIASPSSAITSAVQGGLPSSTPAELAEFQKTGLPVDAFPAWEAMVKAQERNLEQGRAAIREQMAFTGNLAGSPFGQALVDYETQSRLDQNALLGDMLLKSGEAARGRQLDAVKTGVNRGEAASERQLRAGEIETQLRENAAQRRYDAGAMETGLNEAAANRRFDAAQLGTQIQTQLSSIFQGMDQAAIDRALNEFIRTRPEYGPLLQYMLNLSTFVPGVVQASPGIGTQLLQAGAQAVGNAAGGAVGDLAGIGLSKIPGLG